MGAGSMGTGVSAGWAVCTHGLRTLAAKPVETGGVSGAYAGMVLNWASTAGLLGESGLDGGRPQVEAKSRERSDASTGDCWSGWNLSSMV